MIGFPDGRQVQYEADQMEMIEHANATTIHKAQGSECPVVIIPWVKAFYMMLKCNILYTGVTRAKSKVYLVGEWAAVCQAIHTDDSGTRNTILSERIVQYYDQYQSEQKPEMEQFKTCCLKIFSTFEISGLLLLYRGTSAFLNERSRE